MANRYTLIGWHGWNALVRYHTIPGGTDGNDTLNGTAEADWIVAGPGDDVVNASGGNDIVYGQLGNDILRGGDGDDILKGGAGSDWLDGGSGADVLDGQGDDIESGPDNFDVVSYYYSSGVVANLGTDPRFINTGDAAGDTYFNIEGLQGSLGNDVLFGNSGDNILYGMDGEDTLMGGAGQDTLQGGNGVDTLVGGAGDDMLDGGGGGERDTARFEGKFAEYTVTSKRDVTFTVTDTVRDRDGADTLKNIRVLEFSDLTFRFDNNEPEGLTISKGQIGEDALVSTIVASFSSKEYDKGDKVFYDLISSDGPFKIDGNNLILTGAIDYEAKTSYSLTIKAWNGYGAGTIQTFTINVLDVLESNDPKDPNNPNLPLTLWGTSRADRLDGRNANDVLYGLSGNDKLYGNNGNDKLYGGAGKDTLTGGDGQDIFVFDTKLSTSSKVNKANQDKIVDFIVRDDTIHLKKSVFTKLDKKGVLKASEFYQGTKAHDRDDNLIYNKKTGALYYDADGTGAQAQIQIATLSKNLKMTHKRLLRDLTYSIQLSTQKPCTLLLVARSALQTRR